MGCGPNTSVYGNPSFVIHFPSFPKDGEFIFNFIPIYNFNHRLSSVRLDLFGHGLSLPFWPVNLPENIAGAIDDVKVAVDNCVAPRRAQGSLAVRF